MARAKKGDPISGVLLLDKEKGMSSNTAVQIVRRLANAQKGGHTGTLDPMATGLLPVCLGDATKFSADLLNAEKGYEARVRLGVTTDTGDAEGEVTGTRPVEGVTAAMVEAAAKAFLGDIDQVPPMHSALKRDGVCLYKLARRGETVEREPRRVRILEIETSDYDGESFTLRTLVSKGTYIRALAEDIGRRLGVGAHLTALRRTRVGPLTLEGAQTIENLRALATPEAVRGKLTPADSLLTTLVRIDLSAADETRFLLGQRFAPGPQHKGARGRVRVYGPATGLLGTAVMNDRGVLEPERLIAH